MIRITQKAQMMLYKITYLQGMGKLLDGLKKLLKEDKILEIGFLNLMEFLKVW